MDVSDFRRLDANIFIEIVARHASQVIRFLQGKLDFQRFDDQSHVVAQNS